MCWVWCLLPFVVGALLRLLFMFDYVMVKFALCDVFVLLCLICCASYLLCLFGVCLCFVSCVCL